MLFTNYSYFTVAYIGILVTITSVPSTEYIYNKVFKMCITDVGKSIEFFKLNLKSLKYFIVLLVVFFKYKLVPKV